MRYTLTTICGNGILINAIPLRRIYKALKIIRVILLLFSMYGYTQYLVSKRKLKIELALPVLLSAIGAAVFLAGLLNVMKEVSALIFLFGAALGVISLKRRYALRELFTAGTVFCAVAAAVLLFLSYGVKFINYDNLSHWATVVRLLVTENRFPNFEDTVISFQSYPPGSASLIYYFAKITGIRSEWFFMWVQQVATVCFAGSLFVFCRKERPLEYISAAVTAFCSLFCIPGLSILSGILVDELLACLSIAGIAVCYCCREEPQKLLFAITPITVFLVTVKNSGIFFAAILLIFCVYLIVQSGNRKMLICPKNILALLSPFIMLFLWKKHVAYAFQSGMTARHSMSLENYEKMFSQKTPEIISQITGSFLERVFAFDNPFFIILIILLVALLFIKLKKVKVPLCCGTVVLMIGTYLVYQIGNFGMYMFSMPNDEAVILACYDRYHMTGIVFIAGVLWIFLMQICHTFEKQVALKKPKRTILHIVSVTAISAAIWFSATPIANSLKTVPYAGSKRQSSTASWKNMTSMYPAIKHMPSFGILTIPITPSF